MSTSDDPLDDLPNTPDPVYNAIQGDHILEVREWGYCWRCLLDVVDMDCLSMASCRR